MNESKLPPAERALHLIEELKPWLYEEHGEQQCQVIDKLLDALRAEIEELAYRLDNS